MTLTSILADCYRRLSYDPSPATAVVTRLTAFANETHRAILTLPGLDSLRDDTITVASVASTARSALPPDLARIKLVQDRTNNVLLREMTLTELRRRDPGLTSTGNPWAFALIGTLQVATQPSAATGVWAASSSASDNAGPTVSVQAIRTGGYLHTPTATALTGTARVQIGSQTDYIEITKFYLSAACVGDVTLYDAAAAGNVLAVIPKGQTFARYLAIHWYPVPATAITYHLDYTRQIVDLVNGTDEPLLPPDFHDLIGLGVRMKEFETRSDERYAETAAEYAVRLNALRQWVQSDGSLLISLRNRPRRWSQFGGWYPADMRN
jgi:hypothetical protein